MKKKTKKKMEKIYIYIFILSLSQLMLLKLANVIFFTYANCSISIKQEHLSITFSLFPKFFAKPLKENKETCKGNWQTLDAPLTCVTEQAQKFWQRSGSWTNKLAENIIVLYCLDCNSDSKQKIEKCAVDILQLQQYWL